MKPELQALLKRFSELYNSTGTEKPESVSAEWWEAYNDAKKQTIETNAIGERGVKAETDNEGNYVIKLYGSIESWTLDDMDYFLTQAGKKKVKVRIASPRWKRCCGTSDFQHFEETRKRHY